MTVVDTPIQPRPDGALTVRGWRLLYCARGCANAASGAANKTGHVADLGSVYWSCVHCHTVREDRACGPQDFPYDPAPANPETGNLPVTGQEESRCAICRGDADIQAYYAPEGRTGQLVPWCYGCVSTTAGLVVGAGIALTLLPLDPIPGEAELRARLDRAQRGDGAPVDHHAEARAAVRRTRPAAPAGRKPGEWR